VTTSIDSPAATNRLTGSPLEVLMAFLKLGITSFGGPIAHIGYFRGEFVVRRRWLDEAAYADVVGLCQFLPGPASSQVVFTLGLMRAGYCGALAAWTGLRLILASCPRISFGEERSRVAWSNSISAIFGLHPLCSSSPAMDFIVGGSALGPLRCICGPRTANCRRPRASGRGFRAGRAGDAFQLEMSMDSCACAPRSHRRAARE
jgi:hypothetical protein